MADGDTLSGCCTWFLRPPSIKIVIGYCRCELNVVTRGAVPHCHHHGDTLPPQGDHIVATILATLSTHCSHKVATLLPTCRHTVYTVGRQPDLIAQIFFAGHKGSCHVTPSPVEGFGIYVGQLWNVRGRKLAFRCLIMCPNNRALERTLRLVGNNVVPDRE